jgi:hypothetical protein
VVAELCDVTRLRKRYVDHHQKLDKREASLILARFVQPSGEPAQHSVLLSP